MGRNISKKVYFDGTYAQSKSYYDFKGNIVKIVDENSNEVFYEYDCRGFLKTIKSYAETDNGIITEYEYDAEGNITKLSYGDIYDKTMRQTTVNIYNHLGNLTKRVDNFEKVSYYEYDNSGNLIKSVDPNGVTTAYEYDVLRRIVKITNDSEPDKAYAYNLFGETEQITEGEKSIKYAYDERGLVTNIKSGGTTDLFKYDAAGNVISHIIHDTAAGDIKTEYAYDKLNRVTKVITPVGTQTLVYDRPAGLF